MLRVIRYPMSDSSRTARIGQSHSWRRSSSPVRWILFPIEVRAKVMCALRASSWTFGSDHQLLIVDHIVYYCLNNA